MGNQEYETQLLFKLKALRAVLDITLEKIDRTRLNSNKDMECLNHIATNLEGTRNIIDKAIYNLKHLTTEQKEKMFSSNDKYTELSSIDEYQKFKNMPAITLNEVADVDLVDLCRRLQE